MKVRVFVPQDADASLFRGSDYSFAQVPAVGHVLSFTTGRAGDFMVARIGFVQDGDAFVSALWLEACDSTPRYEAIAPEESDAAEYRDLNCDVPPESMMTY